MARGAAEPPMRTDRSSLGFAPRSFISASSPNQTVGTPQHDVTRSPSIRSIILRATLGGLANSIKDVSYNFVFHLSPEKKNSRQIHWHIEVYPITSHWSGLERGYGVFLNNISPEQAAEKLGAACRKSLANLVGIV